MKVSRPDDADRSPQVIEPGGEIWPWVVIAAAALVVIAWRMLGPSSADLRSWLGTADRTDEPAHVRQAERADERRGPSRAQAIDPGSFLTSDDYPAEALRADAEGVTVFSVDVGSDGMPMRCRVTASSGAAVLDDAVCPAIMRRARFEPARDGDGRLIADHWTSRVRWQIPR